MTLNTDSSRVDRVIVGRLTERPGPLLFDQRTTVFCDEHGQLWQSRRSFDAAAESTWVPIVEARKSDREATHRSAGRAGAAFIVLASLGLFAVLVVESHFTPVVMAATGVLAWFLFWRIGRCIDRLDQQVVIEGAEVDHV